MELDLAPPDLPGFSQSMNFLWFYQEYTLYPMSDQAAGQQAFSNILVPSVMKVMNMPKVVTLMCHMMLSRYG